MKVENTEKRQSVKLKLEFEGWRFLSKKQKNEILKKTRKRFLNANFIDKVGLIIETNDEIEVLHFCLKILDDYKKSFSNWDGYNIRRISKKIIYNYSDKKRKLKLEYFKNLLRSSKFDDLKLVLAGTLYLEPNDVKELLISIERDFNTNLNLMSDKELEEVYRILIMYASSKSRKF